jgi:trk system potassium uptake protein TrkH
MSVFDAITHSFSTIAIGGFSTHDASLGFFNSTAIEIIAIVFMFIAGINFALHFTAWQRRRIDHYFRDPEFLFYGFILLVVSVLTVAVLNAFEVYPTVGETFVKGLFQVVSFATTTGFATGDFHEWPLFLPYVLMYAAIIGACAGFYRRRDEGDSHPSYLQTGFPRGTATHSSPRGNSNQARAQPSARPGR